MDRTGRAKDTKQVDDVAHAIEDDADDQHDVVYGEVAMIINEHQKRAGHKRRTLTTPR